MDSSMKRIAPYLAFAAGVVLLVLLLPQFDYIEPPKIRVTRAEALARADVAAGEVGIPVEKAWKTITWDNSPIMDKELRNRPERRRQAYSDPVVGPEMGWFRVTYFRRGLEKNPPYGEVFVGGDRGEIIGARRRARMETTGAHATEAQLRPLADAFLRTHKLPGIVSPEFESSRPTVLSGRTDWAFRYRIPTNFNAGQVAFFATVYFIGDKFAGWAPNEEYADGHPYRSEGSELLTTFIRFGSIFSLLLILLIIFLRKYHAGEVGVGTGAFLFGAMIVLSLVMDVLICGSSSVGTGFGNGVDAQQTSWAVMSFKFLFYDLPVAVLVFFAWSVGESYARERWGERLASFDAMLRRDAVNATVGRSVLRGLLTSPGVAGAALLVAAIPVWLGYAHPIASSADEYILSLGGPLAVLLSAAMDSILIPVTVLLFVLAFFSRRRQLGLGIAVAAVLGVIAGAIEPPIAPDLVRYLFGFGGILACAAIFLAYDLLATATALFSATMLLGFLPYLAHSGENAHVIAILVLGVPLAALLIFAILGLMTEREVIYEYDDLAAHVKRIVERERVKAEIDAANRIQSALLPVESPDVVGASFASHYRAATEIGGDYFDFLPQPGGEIGIAFGDVSGHGLTSGIVMAMAKAALLVQVDYDASPRAVMEVLNEIVIKTAPKRILMTFFFGLLDPQTQRLRFSSAGHLDPYVYRARERRLEALSSWGFPLGVRRRDPFRELEVDFEAGDRLILYSDGLIEAVDDDGEPFGFERFERTLMESCSGSAEDIKKALLQSVKRFTHNRPPEDDQTLVVISFEAVTEAEFPKPFSVLAAGYSEQVH
jgi:serine phosphatase RsbU (regulator of sigma subunit)